MSYLVNGNYFDDMDSHVCTLINNAFDGDIEKFLDHCNRNWRDYEGQTLVDIVTDHLIAQSDFLNELEWSEESGAMAAVAEDPYDVAEYLFNPLPGDEPTNETLSEDSIADFLGSSTFYRTMDMIARERVIPKVSYGLLVRYGII